MSKRSNKLSNGKVRMDSVKSGSTNVSVSISKLPREPKNKKVKKEDQITVNKINARLRAVKKEFGNAFLQRTIVDELKTDPNLSFTKAGMISAKKSVIDDETLAYLDQKVKKVKDIRKEFENDDRIKKALERGEDQPQWTAKQRNQIIAAQVQAMYNIGGSFESALQAFYDVYQEIEQQFGSNDLILAEDGFMSETFNELRSIMDELYREKNDIDRALHSTGLKTYTELDAITTRISNLETVYVDYLSEKAAYDDAVNEHIQALADKEEK